jgi:hypothetical protein
MPTPSFDAIQTFFADPEATNHATEIMLTSVELFFKAKPDPALNVTGSTAPGVVIQICEVFNNSPDPTKIVPGSTVRVPYDLIYSFSDASIPTVFPFTTPVVLKTDLFYGVMISFEDSTYSLWTNIQGDKIVGTNTPSAGSGNYKDGKYYQRTTGDVFTPLNNTDLKFRINVAKFAANNALVTLVNKDYEFLTVGSKNGTFTGGEYVYQREANATGNVAVIVSNTEIIGDGTSFTSILEGDYIVCWANTTARQVLRVDGVTNATHMVVNTTPRFTNSAAKFFIAPVGKVYFQNGIANKLFLVDSSANSSLGFDAAGVIEGDLSAANAVITTVDTYDVDQFVPRFTLESTDASTIDIQYVISTANVVNTSYFSTATLNKVNRVTKYSGEILSRSTEVTLSDLYGTNKKSAVATFQMNVAQSNTSLYNVPRIRTNELDFFVLQNRVNNTYKSGNTDTEVSRNGLATSKYISAKTSFANNRFAEDLRVYMTAHRPVGTSLLVYAKLHNSNDTETFDDKSWTPLTYIQNGDKYGSTEDVNDLIEYELAIPAYPETEFTVTGSFTTTLSSAVVTANGFDPSANLVANDMVKVYNPLIEENYTIGFVTAANSTTITLSAAIANNNVVGSGYYVDKLRYKQTAFLNKEANNKARYFTLAMAPVDTFDSMQFKIVLLANNSAITPSVDEFQAIGLNAGS